MVKKQRHTPTFASAVVRHYVVDNMPINAICRKLGTSYVTVKTVLCSHGIPLRGRGSHTLRGSDHPSSKLSSADLEDLEIKLRAWEDHGQLAKQFGISRERVRQIAKQIGAPTGRQLQQRRRAEKQKAIEARRAEAAKKRAAEQHARYNPWRTMWREQVPVKEMAARLGLKPGAVSVRIVNLRKEHPTWFPKRRGV